jgi:hypothetical protein
MSARVASASIFDFPTTPTKTRTAKKTGVAAKQAKSRVVTKTKRKTEADPGPRTSQILADILLKNPKDEYFTVAKLLEEIGTTSFGTSLMFFAIPEVIPIPIPGMSALVVLPTAFCRRR